MKLSAKFGFILPLVSSLILTGCNDENNKTTTPVPKNAAPTEAVAIKSLPVFNTFFSTDIVTLDYLLTMRTSNSDHYTNFVEGLLENDQYGNLVPAMATSWEVSPDGLTYTYHLRKGVKWVDSDGNEYAEVTANDFVTGLKHAVEVRSEMLSIISDSIEGLKDYADGKENDFNKVGVKAVDNYTLQYKLARPESFWNSKTTYSILYPVNADFLKEKGKDFGKPTPNGILYNGPFILKNNTAKSVIEYERNPTYWDPKNIHVDNVKLTFNDGQDQELPFKLFKEGKIEAFSVQPNLPIFPEVQKLYGKNIITSLTRGSTFNMTFNFNRNKYNLTLKTSDKQKEDTKKAIANRDFRLAILFAFDKKNYNAQTSGIDYALVPLRNTLTPPGFVKVNNEYYGDVVQRETRALDPEAFNDVDFGEANNSYYNPEKAKKYFAKAKETLLKQNVEFPIHLDLPELETSARLVKQAKSLKASIEESLGTDNIIIDLNLANRDKYLSATYQADRGQDSDYDISNASGWGPDYTDPSTYLDIYNSKTGAQLHTIGLENVHSANESDISAPVKQALGLAEYDALLDKANAITNDDNARNAAYAKAEAWLTNKVLQIPIYADGGVPFVTKAVPFSGAYGETGIASRKYKYIQFQETPVTAEEYSKAKAQWLEKRKNTTQ